MHIAIESSIIRELNQISGKSKYNKQINTNQFQLTGEFTNTEPTNNQISPTCNKIQKVKEIKHKIRKQKIKFH